MSGKGSISKQNSAGKKTADHGQKIGCTKSCDFGLRTRRWKFISPVRHLKNVGGKVGAVVLRLTSWAAVPKSHRYNHVPTKEGAKTSVAPIDSQRAEAIHDCIDFINSSSSLPRSNSVAR